MPDSLIDKCVLVTGASRGLGRAIAIGCAEEGATVIVNYLRDREAAEEVVSIIRANGGNAVSIKADVSNRTEVQALTREVVSLFGKIDVLVNNAGINKRATLDETTDDDWDEIMSVNLKGPFMCCQEVMPYMKISGGGRIINISSVASQYYGPKTVHYAVSKAGLNALTKVLARYGAPNNILVNAIAPGLILTDQTRDEFESGQADKLLDLTLLKKPGRLEDVVSAVVFLSSDEQQYMTGQVLALSGGAYLA